MNSGRRSVLNHGILVETDFAALEDGHLPQESLPAVLRGVKCYDPSKMGHQKAITERIEQDPDTDVKKKAVFALSQLPREEGVPLLINVARTNANPAVRKQAMFWLGQSKDPRALAFFEEVLTR